MLNFVLCDDNLNILDRLGKMLDHLFVKHDYNGKIGLKSDNPLDVLTYMDSNSVHVLVLDINLQSDISRNFTSRKGAKKR